MKPQRRRWWTRVRSSITGRFTWAWMAKRYPKSTTTERVKDEERTGKP